MNTYHVIIKNSAVKLVSIIFICLLNVSCEQENEKEYRNSQIDKEMYASFVNYYQKPVISIFEVAANNVPITRNAEGILGITVDDAFYVNSLSLEELIALKAQLMDEGGFTSDEEYEKIIDSAYNEVCKDMSDEDLVKFYKFANDYIEMPEGIISLAQLQIFQNDHHSKNLNDIYVQAAVNIDQIGRKLYDTPVITRSSNFCNKIFAQHLAIASVSMIAGVILPGPGWMVAAAFACELITAGINYKICCRRYSGN